MMDYSVPVGAVFGLVIGSFLNVVIHRLPRMLEARWRRECTETSEDPDKPGPDKPQPDEPYNLATPRSRCPACGHAIRAYENIPVLSWLWLRGKCAICAARISARYPAVEMLTGTLFALITWQVGPGWPAAALMGLTASLVALSFIDYDHQLLPDMITLPLVWAGLLCNVFGLIAPLQDAVIGAIAGYLVLWLAMHGFRLLTGKEGMGYGDFKLLSALGAWFGWQMLPFVVLAASFAGAVIGIGLIVLRGRDRQLPIPFGPYLCIAGFVAALWGRAITDGYLTVAGLR